MSRKDPRPRKKPTLAKLEKRLLKNEKAIQYFASQSYEIRQLIEKIKAEPKQEPFVKPLEGKENVGC